uniref:DUF2254 domain-containing protein n=1 Tax=Cephaloticoccus sp. TaxID=1985742 RepID=UPI00404958EB
MSKLKFLLNKLASQLWVRPACYSMAALFWVFLGTVAEYFLQGSWGIDISRETLVNLFSILASTMLTVAIFSVSAIAAAYASVSTTATPRATKIVVRDSGTQTILGAFLATFIYAVVSLTALSAIQFKPSGRLMLFIGFVFLVTWVLLSFLRWVDRVTKLGRMGDTLERVVAEGRKVFSDPQLSLLGCASQHEATRPADGHELIFTRYGYVQNIDMPALQAVATKLDAEIWLDVRPGKLAQRGQIYGVLAGGSVPDKDDQRALTAAVSIGSDRNFSMDPRFVLIILAEIAGKALSPAVNDPGTAIQVMGLELELLHTWVEMDQGAMGAKPKFDRIRVPAIAAQCLIEDAFAPIVRDGAGSLEV